MKVLDRVDKLELDQKQDSDMILRMTVETKRLKKEVRDLKIILEEKEEIIAEKSEKENVMDVLEMKCKDLEDDLIMKIKEGSSLKMDIILKEKDLEEEKLKCKIKNVKQKTLSKC